MAKKPIEIIDNSEITRIEMFDVMTNAFGRYAKYIIQDRALPDVRDGLKPVQRRIIYAMNNLGILHNHPHKKSARSVGEVIGKYHPHGDTSIYEAMVRMSQNWKNNIPLIDMHGCNGSIDGDSAAAMRYTEARLSYYSELMISRINKNTVKFIDNFDGSESEPTVLPTLIPNLLINGATGIAAGYACNIPPFNAVEIINSLITRIDSPNCELQTIINIMPGPDFPTGGIINSTNIQQIYETGKGRINIYSKIELVNKKQAYITQIPFEVNKAELIEEINDLAEKFNSLNIIECHDESDYNGISICINFRNTDNFEYIKNFLYKNTQLKVTYGVNMVVINNRKPCLIGIREYLDAFIKHCNDIILSETKYDLDKANARLEIVNGLIKATSMIDQIIDLIRKCKDKKHAFDTIKELGFTERQSEAIINLQLYKLTNYDTTEFVEEQKILTESITKFNSIINDEKYRSNHLKNILREYRKTFNGERKTTINDVEIDTNVSISNIIEDKKLFVYLSKDGYIKAIPAKADAANTFENYKIKENDLIIKKINSNNKNIIIFVTNKGRYINIPVYKLKQCKWTEMGTHINSLVEIDVDEKVITCFDYNENKDNNIIIATSDRLIKQCAISKLTTNNKLIKDFTIFPLEPNQSVIFCDIVIPTIENKIGLVTKLGKIIFYPTTQVSIVGRNATGVFSISEKDDVVSAFIDSEDKKYIVVVCENGIKRIEKSIGFFVNKKNQTMKPLFAQQKEPLIVKSCFLTTSNDTITLYGVNGECETLSVSHILISDTTGRLSKVNVKNIYYGILNLKEI